MQLNCFFIKLENGLKKDVRNVARTKHGFVELVVTLFTLNTRCDYVIPYFTYTTWWISFISVNGKENCSYDPTDWKRGCCQQVCIFAGMKLCHKLYYPEKQLSVGKSLALFKCQLHFKQYMKTKRVCFGIELYKRISSNAIALNFSVNSRRMMFHNGDENSDMSAPERTSFYRLFFDFYW